MFNEKMANRIWGNTLSVVAIVAGLTDSARYVRTLQIKAPELPRYFKKTANLSMCYAGFAQDFSFNQAMGAGHAAFLSCAYDVVTDWHKPLKLQNTYAGILQKETSPELTAMAIGLLRRDFKSVLLDDGLERGVVATEFVLQMMRVREIFDRKCDIKQRGLVKPEEYFS